MAIEEFEKPCFLEFRVYQDGHFSVVPMSSAVQQLRKIPMENSKIKKASAPDIGAKAAGSESEKAARASSRLLTSAEASEYLLGARGVRRTPATLARLRREGRGPRYVRDWVRPLYPVSELDGWVDSVLLRRGLVASTAQESRYHDCSYVSQRT